MRKSRFTEAQIIGMIKEQEAGMPTAEVCRKHGLSQGTFYKFKSQYGGMEVSDAAKLRAMTDENAKLKRLLADTMLNLGMTDLCRAALADLDAGQFASIPSLHDDSQWQAWETARDAMLPHLSSRTAAPRYGA